MRALVSSIKKIIPICLAVSLLTGCGGALLAPTDARHVETYNIHTNSVTNNCTSFSVDKVISFAEIPAMEPFNTTKMYYSLNDYQAMPYAYSQWIVRPSNMIWNSAYQSLISSCNFKGVVTSDSMTKGDYNVSLQLLFLMQDYSVVPAITKTKLLVQVNDVKTSKLVAIKHFDLQTPTDKGPYAFAISASKLGIDFNQQLNNWLVHTIQNNK